MPAHDTTEMNVHEFLTEIHPNQRETSEKHNPVSTHHQINRILQGFDFAAAAPLLRGRIVASFTSSNKIWVAAMLRPIATKFSSADIGEERCTREQRENI